jgi:hypothetical protein
VTFSYGETEHGIVVQVDLAGIPVATTIGVSSDGAKLIEVISGNNEEFDRSEQISLAEARGWDAAAAGPGRPRREPEALPEQHRVPARWPRSRVRRLPDGDGEPRPSYTAADRAAAVEEFMTSPGGGRGRRGGRGVDPVLGRGAHRLQRADPRRAAGPGGPAQARAHPARPRAEHLRPDPGPARLPRARGDRLDPLVAARAGAGRGGHRGADGAAAAGAQPVRRGLRRPGRGGDPRLRRPAWPPAPPTSPGCPTAWAGGCSRCRYRTSTPRWTWPIRPTATAWWRRSSARARHRPA